MKIYHVANNAREAQLFANNGVRHFLISYYYLKQGCPQNMAISDYLSLWNLPEDSMLMLDSGAHSADTLGVPLNVFEYAEFLIEHQKWFNHIVNLDVIRDAEQTQRNAEILLTAGVNPDKFITVFHEDEDWSYLDRMVSEFDYVGIGFDHHKAEQLKKVDELYPLDQHKFHFFGMGSPKLMRQFPNLYSCDSSNIIRSAVFGCVIALNGSVSFSLRRDGKQHFIRQPDEVKSELIERIIRHDLDFDDCFGDDAAGRVLLNTDFYVQLEQQLAKRGVWN